MSAPTERELARCCGDAFGLRDTKNAHKPIPSDEAVSIRNLGACNFESPLTKENITFFEDERVVFCTSSAFAAQGPSTPISEVKTHHRLFEHAGPRQNVFYDPKNTKVGIVTCGGLCPGINNVIRGLVLCFYHRYGVHNIVGLKNGYQGLIKETSQQIMLTPSFVKDIHKVGGSVLGSSRGAQNVSAQVDFLQDHKFDILICIGGDGTLSGALEISEEVQRRGLKIAVIGVPKTIDNDIVYTDRTFGFETAVEMAQAAINAAHCEARSVENGIGLVKLMGRDSGFIALYASLASGDVNLLLIPENKFCMEKLMNYLLPRLKASGHCVVVASEGAGQDIFPPIGADASGNKQFVDIGVQLKKEIGTRLKQMGISHEIKLIDPSYTIRSSTANASDSVFCLALAHAAVHSAMAGKTGMMVSHLNGHFIHLPLQLIRGQRKYVSTASLPYQAFLDNSGMPSKL